MTNPLSALFARAAAALRKSPPGKSPPARTPPFDLSPSERAFFEKWANRNLSGDPIILSLPRELTGTELKLIAASNDFAFELLRQVQPFSPRCHSATLTRTNPVSSLP